MSVKTTVRKQCLWMFWREIRKKCKLAFNHKNHASIIKYQPIAILEDGGNFWCQILSVSIRFWCYAKLGERLTQLRISVMSTNVVEWYVNKFLLPWLRFNFLRLHSSFDSNARIYNLKGVINLIHELGNAKFCKPICLSHFECFLWTLLPS